MISRSSRFALLFALATLVVAPHGIAKAQAQDSMNASGDISGPVEAQLIRVIDGDTLLVSAKPWPQQSVEVYVRLRGIDAPETKAKCVSVRDAGLEAKERLISMIGAYPRLQLTHIEGDKYFGRVVANVILPDGRNPAQELLSGGYVAAYDGGRKAKRCEHVW